MRVYFICFLMAIPAVAQDFSDIKVEKVAAGYTFTEGPVYAREGFLLWSDVPNNRIWKLAPGEKAAVFRENSNGTNGNTYDAKGNLYSCENRLHRVIRTDKKGKIEVVADRFEGKRLNAPNDITVRRDGHVYFTDPAFGDAQNQGRELDFYGIYHVPPKGPIELIAKPKGRPNGVVLSPDGKTLYVDNSDDRAVYAYDLDRNGKATNERVLVSGIDGSPDGMAIDEKGNLYVTANKVDIYSPEGKLIHQIEIAEMPRNCAFGDPDFQTLYVTALTSVYRIRMPVKGAVPY
ncbi:MAG: SMP-30/gluconolactonase/LRE family protein [Bryobacteraceae bacterium]